MLLTLCAPSAAAQEPLRVGVSLYIEPADRVEEARILRTCIVQRLEGLDGVVVDGTATSWLRIDMMEAMTGDGRMIGYAVSLMAIETVKENGDLPWILLDRTLMTIGNGPIRDTCSGIVDWYQTAFVTPMMGG